MAPPHDRDVALLIYTSGTTGRPKGAMLSQAAVAASADMVASDTSVSPADRLLLVMPQFHIGAQNWENAQRLAGGTVFLHRSFDAEACLRAIQDDKITIAVFAPTMLQALLERPDLPSYDLSSLRAVVYSAAAMHLATLRQAITAFGPVLVQQYGQTEGIGTVLPASDHLPGGNEVEIRRLASVGRPFPGCGVKIVDEDDIEQPVGTSGELCLQGPSIMSGYWNNSAASVATLSGGWLHTGDMAKLDADGYIYLVDRKKDVIISGGENIYSLEVENAVIAHPAVARVAVVGMPDAKWGEAVCAFVVLVPDAALTEADIIAHTRRLIANYKAPRKVVLVDALPELASGKVAKNDLRTLARTIAENVAAR